MNALTLYGRYVSASLRAQAQYPSATLMLTAGHCAATAIEVLGLFALFDRFGSVGGWSFGEAALFYGLFLRGHSAEALRRDIDVPRKLLNKLMFRHRNEQAVRQKLQRAFLYRKQVLSIFVVLVTREQAQDRASVRVL